MIVSWLVARLLARAIVACLTCDRNFTVSQRGAGIYESEPVKGARRLRCVPGGRLSPLRLLLPLLPSLLDTDML